MSQLLLNTMWLRYTFRNWSGVPQNCASTLPISNLAIYRIRFTVTGAVLLLEKVLLSVPPIMGLLGRQLPALQGKKPFG